MANYPCGFLIRVKILILSFLLGLGACTSVRQAAPPENILLSQQIKNLLHQTLPSVVGVSAVFNYRATDFHHHYSNGRLSPDRNSPTGFRLLPPPAGMTTNSELDFQKINGGGVIIYSEEERAVVITCAHIFTKPDTIDQYERTEAGKGFPFLVARKIKASQSFYASSQANQYFAAEILYADVKADLALLLVQTTKTLGPSFPFPIAASGQIEWGDFVYVIGYPREVKQLTTGVVSEVTFLGTFIVDAVARFGFSGGPVLVVRPGAGLELAGIIRSVPANKIRIVAPPKHLPTGQILNEQDLRELAAQEIDLIDYGTTYASSVDPIKKFLREARAELKQKGIVLEAKYGQD